MDPLKTGLEALESLSLNPTAENLEAFFIERTSESDLPIVDVGCGTVGLFNGLSSALKPQDAFSLLAAAAKILIKQSSTIKVEQALDIVSKLVMATDTSEIPIDFELLMNDIDLKVNEMKKPNLGSGVWEYIKKQYRWG